MSQDTARHQQVNIGEHEEGANAKRVTIVDGSGSEVSIGTSSYNYVQKDEGVTYIYYGFASTTGWKFKRKTIATGVWMVATGVGDYATNWTDRASKTYVYA